MSGAPGPQPTLLAMAAAFNLPFTVRLTELDVHDAAMRGADIKKTLHRFFSLRFGLFSPCIRYAAASACFGGCPVAIISLMLRSRTAALLPLASGTLAHRQGNGGGSADGKGLAHLVRSRRDISLRIHHHDVPVETRAIGEP